MRRILNWVKDPIDTRDFQAPYGLAKTVTLPKKVDLRRYCSNVEDQGELGSCTGNAIAGALELLDMRDKGGFTDLSRLFIYYNERVIEGTVREDAGAYIRDGIKSVHKQGAAAEDLWPYDIGKFAVRPTTEAYADAAKRKFTAYRRVTTRVPGIKEALAAGYPVVFGFTVYTDFLSERVARSGRLLMPKPDESVEGGHAVLAVGYNDSSKKVIVRNSWGPQWGLHGYFTMPYAYLQDENLSDDFWIVTGK